MVGVSDRQAQVNQGLRKEDPPPDGPQCPERCLVITLPLELELLSQVGK